MKIVHIVPGFGGTFYCGNCLRDSAFASSLRKAGHQATLLPMYLPLTFTADNPAAEAPVFYGAVSIYLKQMFPFMKHMPVWMEKWLNSPSMLRFAAAKSGSTRASGLENLTESMLLGAEGNQNQELQQLVDFLKHKEKPDVVHVSNALLIGMAGKIREEANIPVICSLQDEDVWVDAMENPYRDQIWDLLAEKAGDVDAFVAVSHYFAEVMKKRLHIPESRLHVLPIGIDPGKYHYHEPETKTPAIGYLSRICEENGFGILVDAFIHLKSEKRFHHVKLKATGGHTGDDNRFIREQMQKLREKGIIDDVEILPDFSPQVLHDFFRSITVLSVPVLKGEAFGLYQLESLASGIPLVQPELGAFPEIIGNTGGGVTYSPNTPLGLFEKLSEVLSDKQKLLEMSRSGREAVIREYDSALLAEKMVSIYSGVL